jgi:hypothetical protein
MASVVDHYLRSRRRRRERAEDDICRTAFNDDRIRAEGLIERICSVVGNTLEEDECIRCYMYTVSRAVGARTAADIVQSLSASSLQCRDEKIAVAPEIRAPKSVHTHDQCDGTHDRDESKYDEYFYKGESPACQLGHGSLGIHEEIHEVNNGYLALPSASDELASID